jgi:tRNA(fMet)-specific endonuclease VapC
MSVVSLTELRLDVNRQYEPGTDRHREAMDGLDRPRARFEVLDVEWAVAVTAADIIADLRERGDPLDDLHDIYLVATARTRQLPVLTVNVDYFERIDDVRVTDWSAF